jgi:hypothetical protein
MDGAGEEKNFTTESTDDTEEEKRKKEGMKRGTL